MSYLNAETRQEIEIRLSTWPKGPFRPIQLRGLSARNWLWDGSSVVDPTLFAEADIVRANHVSQTPFGKLVAEDGRAAIWFGHGSSYGKRADGSFGQLPSDVCWHENPNHKI